MAPPGRPNLQGVAGRDHPPYLADAVKASPQLRRDINTALQLGISPRRYAGWEPATIYTYDKQGRIRSSRPEPEWDEFDELLVDVLREWEAGLYSCGHHRDDNLNRDLTGVPEFATCRFCQALQSEQQKLADGIDKAALKAGKNPDYPRRWIVRIVTKTQAAIARSRTSPEQKLAEYHARNQPPTSDPAMTVSVTPSLE